MGIFSDIGSQKSNTDTIYLTEGDYELSVHAVKLVESKRGKGTFFIVEFNVDANTGENSTPEGTPVSWVCKMGGEHPESALKDVKSFLMATTGAVSTDVDEAFTESALANDGEILWERRVSCRVVAKPTLRGGTFSKHHWSPAPGMA